MKRLLALLLAMAMMLSLASCGSGGKAPAGSESPSSAPVTEETAPGDGADAVSTKDTLVVAIPSDPNSLDFNNNIEGYNGLMIKQLGETLVECDDEGNIVPLLAESYEYEDDVTIVWHIRQGVTFHNGESLTAHDVEYTFGRCMEHPVISQDISCVDIENSYCEDDYTFVMKLKEPSAPLLYTLALAPFSIVCQSYCEANDDTTIASNPVGTGPYKFVSWATGTDVILEAYDGYWNPDGTAKIKNLHFKIIAEAANRTIELETGNVDLALDIQVADTPLIEGNDDLQLLVGTGTGVTFGLINQRRAPLDDVNVRLALVKATDREAVCQAIYDDYATVPNSVYAETLWAYDDTYAAENYGYDPDAAKALLAEAGYDESNPLHLDIVVSQSGNASSVAEIISNMWGQIGIQTDIAEYEAGTYFEFFDNFDYDVTFATQTATSPDPDSVTFVLFYSFAMAMWSSDETDALLELERTTTDIDERYQAFVDFQRICQEKVAVMPVLTASVISAANKDLAGLPNLSHISNDASYASIYWTA